MFFTSKCLYSTKPVYSHLLLSPTLSYICDLTRCLPCLHVHFFPLSPRNACLSFNLVQMFSLPQCISRPVKVSSFLCAPTALGTYFGFKHLSCYVFEDQVKQLSFLLYCEPWGDRLTHLFIPSANHRNLPLKFCFRGTGK